MKWRSLKISTNQPSIADCTPQWFNEIEPGLHLIYVHGRYITSGISKEPESESLKQLFDARTMINQTDWRADDWVPPEEGVVLFGPTGEQDAQLIPKAKAAIGAIRKAENEQSQRKKLVILVHPILWDVLISRDGSPLIVGENNVHEYLLWPTHGLCESNIWSDENEDNRHKMAWSGSGWMSTYFLSDHMTVHTLSTALEARLVTNSQQLHWYDQQLVEFSNEKVDVALTLKRQPNTSHVLTLCEFLPRYWNERTQAFRRSSPTGPQGPIEWKAGDNLLKFTMHQRQLLLDSWLTPWQAEDGRIYIQPASLAVLYWAANLKRKLQADTPQHFLDHFQWHQAAWFGGRWQPTNQHAETQ